MRYAVEHPLTDTQAKRAVERAHAEYAQRFARFEPKLVWQDARVAQVTFSANGLSLGGRIRLRPGEIVFRFEVPFLLKPFAKKAKARIAAEVQRWVLLVQQEQLQGPAKT